MLNTYFFYILLSRLYCSTYRIQNFAISQKSGEFDKFSFFIERVVTFLLIINDEYVQPKRNIVKNNLLIKGINRLWGHLKNFMKQSEIILNFQFYYLISIFLISNDSVDFFEYKKFLVVVYDPSASLNKALWNFQFDFRL